MGKTCRRTNITRDNLKERFLKVIEYDPDLTNKQIKIRFNLDNRTIRKWKKEVPQYE